jgi:hypothetical protein
VKRRGRRHARRQVGRKLLFTQEIIVYTGRYHLLREEAREETGWKKIIYVLLRK